MGKGLILSEIRVITGRRVLRRSWGNGSKHVKGTRGCEKSPASNIYTTWARIFIERNIFCTLGGGRTTAGSNAPGPFLFNLLKFLLVVPSPPPFFFETFRVNTCTLLRFVLHSDVHFRMYLYVGATRGLINGCVGELQKSDGMQR